MPSLVDEVFRAIADPTRWAFFGHLSREREKTVHVLTDRAGVSQPTVSRPLGVLKPANPVSDRQTRTIFTIDRRDFSIIRLKRNRSLRLTPEIQ